MRFKITKNPSRNKSQIERGWSAEVRKLRTERPELSLYEARLRMLDIYEDEVVLTEADKQWVAEKREALSTERHVRRTKASLLDLIKGL